MFPALETISWLHHSGSVAALACKHTIKYHTEVQISNIDLGVGTDHSNSQQGKQYPPRLSYLALEAIPVVAIS